MSVATKHHVISLIKSEGAYLLHLNTSDYLVLPAEQLHPEIKAKLAFILAAKEYKDPSSVASLHKDPVITYFMSSVRDSSSYPKEFSEIGWQSQADFNLIYIVLTTSTYVEIRNLYDARR
jgi:hypothetical protein